MRRYQCCQVLFLMAALTPAVCAGQNAAALPLVAPAQASGTTANVVNCRTIAAGDPSLDLVSKLCEFALTYRHQLPDFIVQQTTTFQGPHSTSVMTEQVTFRKGLENYSHLTIDGKPIPPDTPLPRNIRFTSAGEFGSNLVDLFAVAGATEFKFRKTSILRDVPVAIYEFHVPEKKNTFWTLRDGNGRAWRPELRGEVWLELQTGHPLREELEAIHLPSNRLIDSAKTVTDYAMTPVAEVGTFLLPVKSESAVCSRPRAGFRAGCATSVLVFHDYQKFAATTRILTSSSQP